MYLEEKLERLDKRQDTLERLTEERFNDLAEAIESNRDFITASNAGTLEGLMNLLKQIENLSKRVELLEGKETLKEANPSLFPAEAAKQ